MSCFERPSQRIWKIINMLSSTICIFSKKSFKTVLLENLIHGVYHLWSERGKRKCSNCKWKVLVAQLCLTLLQPHGLQLVRLLWLWNSPGKNIGVGCYSLFKGILPTQDQTWLSHIADRFLTVWATREAQNTEDRRILRVL